MARPAPILARTRPQHSRSARPPVAIPATSSVSSNGLAALLGLPTTTSTTTVSEGSVTGLPAIQAGIDMISHAVAAMLTDADVLDADGNHLETPPVVACPTGLMGTYEFWTQYVDCLMKRGNHVAILADFDIDGTAQQVVPAHPDAVSMDDSLGLPYYTIGAVTFRWDEVVHARHGAPVGSLWGAGIVERYRTAVLEQMSQAEYGRTSFSSGAVPSAVVQLDKPTISSTEAEEVQDNWIERHGGGINKPAVISKSMSITPLSWSPHDAEFIESRRVSVAMAALMCGLDPADLGASIGGNGLTYANLTDRQLSRILSSFMPWMRICEEAWSRLLPDGQFVRGNVEALLRSSTKERFEVYEIGQRIGAYTVDEIRTAEKRPTIETDQNTPPAPEEEPAA